MLAKDWKIILETTSSEFSKWNVAGSNRLAHGFRLTKALLFDLVVQEGKLMRKKQCVGYTMGRYISEKYQQNNILEKPQQSNKYRKKSDILIESHVRETLVKCEQRRKARLHECVLSRQIHNYTGEKLYECQQYEKSFAQKKRNLEMHAIVEKSFKCEQCDESFVWKKIW